MATTRSNGVELYYELAGAGDVPLVLVHGSWAWAEDWALVVPRLAGSHRVLTYDRRGHSRSERPGGQGSVREDVADLAALLESLGLAPAWLVGNSFGASISLRLAAERPELLRGVIAHEPPLFALLADDPAHAPLLDEVGRRIAVVVEHIASGDHARAAEEFVDGVALGPGSWAGLPEAVRRTLIDNAPTFLDEVRDPEQLRFEPSALAAYAGPLLLTMGDQSPPTFAPVVEKLAAVQPRAEVRKFPGVGHIPHVTDPEEYAATVTRFVAAHEARARS